MNHAEEIQLVRRAMAGDDGARTALWSAHRRWLAAVLLARRPARVDLEDLLQEVAMKFVSQIHTLQDAAALRPWLRVVALNVARSAGRRVQGESKVMQPLMTELPDPRVEAARRQDQVRQRADHVLDLIGRLQPEYREPLLLRCVRGLSQKEVAAALELPVTTVETRLARARRALRREIQENPPGEPDHESRAARAAAPGDGEAR